MGLLDNQVAVVTGAAQGIGFAIAELFAKQGAFVVLGDRNGAAADHAASEIGNSAVAIECDVTDAEAVERLVQAASTYGRVGVMVNNAGLARDATIRKMTGDQFDDVVEVNLRGSWNGIRAAAAIMRENAGGSIINMSSISAKTGILGQTNYSAAKAGVIGLTKAAAKELARYGIRVNALQPGLIRTAMTESMPEHAWEQKLSEIPMLRAGEPAEVASCALFLASEMSSYITGGVLEIAGGRFM